MFSIEESSWVLEELRHCGWRFILFQDSGVSHTYLINNDVASSLLLNLPFFIPADWTQEQLETHPTCAAY